MCLLAASPAAYAQSDAEQQPPLAATLSVAEGTWIRADESLEVRLNRPIPASEGRLAVMIGEVDWTGVFESSDRSLRYRPATVRLPSGERPLVVYVVSPDNTWREISRFQLRVLTRGGYEKAEAAPSVDVLNKGQLAQRQFPLADDSSRATFQDFNVNGGMRTSLVRGGWTTTTQFNVVGVSRREEALRWAIEQDAAPLVDLAAYSVSAQNHVAGFSLGHVTFGAHRQLFNGFASRGGLAEFKFGPRTDLKVTALNGTTVVGWDNFLGLQQENHRLFGATFGVEVTPRAGAVRLEFSGLDGRLLPLTNFNAGKITDAETSRGIGIRVIASDPSQRFRLDGGYARSRFGNPDDPLLSQNVPLVAVQRVARDARYLDVSYALVQNKPIGASTPFSLIAAFRHEKVEPLYGSVMSFVRADVFQNAAELTGTVGPASIQASYTRSHDNLDGLASILETRTHLAQVTASFPLATFAQDSPREWLPTVTYGLNRTHQFGARLPENSDFQETHVPDQMSTNQVVGLEWAGRMWRGGYRFNRSFQDNRQIGRTLSDLANLTNNVSVGLTPDPRVDLNLELAFEGAENRELVRTDITRRIGVSSTWRPSTRTALLAAVSRTFLHADVETSENRNTDISLQLSQTFPLSRRTSGKPEGQVFVRYARQSFSLLDALFGVNEQRRLWTVNSGFTLSLF